MTKLPDPLGGRSITEWIGKTPDEKVPRRVRERVLLRHGRHCAETGIPILAGDEWECDHIVPLSSGGEHRESNLQPLLKRAHILKTAAETHGRAKADRVRAKHLGTWPKSKARIRGRGFPKTRGDLDD